MTSMPDSIAEFIERASGWRPPRQRLHELRHGGGGKMVRALWLALLVALEDSEETR